MIGFLIFIILVLLDTFTTWFAIYKYQAGEVNKFLSWVYIKTNLTIMIFVKAGLSLALLVLYVLFIGFGHWNIWLLCMIYSIVVYNNIKQLLKVVPWFK